MDIFLVPVGDGRHELYCEVPAAAPVDDGPSSGWMRRQVRRFRSMLAEAEDERLRRERGEASTETGLSRWVLRKLAEVIAEQRLLWNLRGESAACLVHPADLESPAALALMRTAMTADHAKHRRWMIVDIVITSITGPVFFMVPGPNVLSWFFAFRALGHYYAMRGASRALTEVDWHTRPSADLSSLRAALGLGGAERRTRLAEIAEALGLKALPGFVERVARST